MADERFRAGRVRVRVPATSANLGPGFDALGLALELHDEIEAWLEGPGVRVSVTGEGADQVPDDHTHLVAASALDTFDRLGAGRPGLMLRCVNRIPQARGLGSSSAAIVAGVLAARALLTDGTARASDAAVLAWAAEAEGHPDNVAPCLYGGATVAWSEAAGACAVRLEPDARLRPVALVPRGRGLTEVARRILPGAVSHADAVANAGRAALLVHALTAMPELLLPATEDRLHQRYRATAMPDSLDLVDRLREAGSPAVLSGAGPTVLTFVSPGQSLDRDLLGELGARFAILPLGVDRAGATVWF